MVVMVWITVESFRILVRNRRIIKEWVWWSWGGRGDLATVTRGKRRGQAAHIELARSQVSDAIRNNRLRQL